MPPLFFYLLKVILVSGILTGYYWISLRNNKFHYYNRFYLMGTLLLSLALPLLNLQWFSFSPAPSSPVHQVSQLIYFTPNSGAASSILEWDQLLAIGCCLISGILVLLFLIGIIKLYLIKSKGRVTPMEQFDFIETSLEEAPFSFFRNLFWKKELPLHDQAGQRMLQHELAHIQQLHSLDKVIVTLSTYIFWMNPFFWMIRKELEVVHEFIADEEAIAGNDAALLAEMLLTAHYPSNIFSNGQSFFYSSIKRRIIMLTSSAKTSYSYTRRLLVLPISMGLLALLSFTIQNNRNENDQSRRGSIHPSTTHLDTIPAQFRDAKSGNLKGSYQIDIQGDTVIFKDKKSKKSLFTVPLSQLGELAHLDKSSHGNSLVSNKKFIFISGDSLTAKRGMLINGNLAPLMIAEGVELNGIAPSAIKTINIKGNELNIKLDSLHDGLNSLHTAANYLQILSGNEKKMYVIVSDQKRIDTITVQDISLEKNKSEISVANKTGAAPESVTVTAKKADGSLIYTYSMKAPANDDLPKDVLYVIDGKEADAAAVKALDANAIKSINVLKGNSTSKYGEKGKNGVIEIITKK